MSTPTWYDLLGVEPDAEEQTIRAAWRAAIADLDPTARRFATLNEAAAVLLDPTRRSAYDAELAESVEAHAPHAEPTDADLTHAEPVEAHAAHAEPTDAEPVEADVLDAEPTDAEPVEAQPVETHTAPAARPYLVPIWTLASVAVVAVAALVLAIVLETRPTPDKIIQADVQLSGGSKVTQVEEHALAAEAAAKDAIVPVLSYDYRHLDADKAAADAHLTDAYRTTYDKNFDGPVRTNAVAGQFVITASVLRTGIVRVGADRVQVLVLFDQTRTDKASTTPATFQNKATLTMRDVGGTWLVDDVVINQTS